MKKGLTIIELLVAMVILTILLSSATYLFVNYISTSLSQERVATMQSDVQSVLAQIKWDILMTGYSVSSDQFAVESENGTGPNNSDKITLRSLWFGVEDGGHWSYVLDPVAGSSTINVRRWNEPRIDIEIGDKLILLTSTKQKLIEQMYEVTARDTFTHTGGIPGYELTLDNPISSSMNFLFSTNGVTEITELEYRIDNGILLRDNEPILDNVEDLQFAYWIDENANQVQEPSEWHNDLTIVENDPGLSDNIRLIRLSLLVSSRGEQGYEVNEIIAIEDNTITPNTQNVNRLYTSIANPRNIR